MRRLVLLLVASTTVLGAALPAACGATSIAGPNGKIAFTSARPSIGVPSPNAGDAGARIFVADYPNGTPEQVTTLPEGATVRHRQPNWSPDHTRIAYAAGSGASYAIWIVDLRTGAQTEFVSAAAETDRPSWSPDGKEIAYGSEGDLWVKEVSDTSPSSKGTRITNTVGITEERPVWSPDGNTLYYNRGVPPFTAGNKRDIYRKSPPTLAGAEIPVIATTADEWQPSLSPAGDRLCYLQGPQSSEAKLRTIGVNGLGDAAFTGDGVTGALNCVWSPDGSTILYTKGAFSTGELVTRDINGGSFAALTGMNFEAHFDGNSDWATNFSPTCDAKDVNVGFNGFLSIGLSCTDPDAGAGAAPPTPTRLDPEALEIVTTPGHGAIGALNDGRVVYTPNKDFQGTDTFTYTGTDGVSEAKPATVTVHVSGPPKNGGGGGSAADTTAPKVSAIKLSASTWRLGKALATISKAPVGTTISFKLSEAASAKLSFQRAVRDRKTGRVRQVSAGSLRPLPGRAGKNKVRFQGRLSSSKTLVAGRYRVVVSARDAAGNSSKPVTGPNFTIAAG